LRVNVYHGPARQLDDSADVTLTTYAILRLDSEDLSRRRFDAAVIDEAQPSRTPTARWRARPMRSTPISAWP
jgi:SNF2 family DNA or RNA helicase